MQTKTVLLQLQPVQVKVLVQEDATEQQILKLAEEQAVAKMQDTFPHYSYNISEGNVMTLVDCEPGRMVRINGELGYIFEVKPNRKFPVGLVLAGGVKKNAKPVALEAVSDDDLLGTLWIERQDFMKELQEWSSGDMAYIPTKNGVLKVVISKVTKSKIEAFELRTKVTNKYTPITPGRMRLLCDSEEQAKALLD